MQRPPVFRLPDSACRGALQRACRAPLSHALSVILSVAGLALASPAQAGDDAAPAARERDPLEIFQASEDRLFRVGYRLATANAPFCEQAIKVSGLLIHDADSYGDAAAVRSRFHLSGDVAAQAVAPGSPAARAGLAQNDTILAVDGRPIDPDWPTTEPRWKRGFAIRDAIDAALTRGMLDLSWQSPGGSPRSAIIAGVAACPTRFELIDSKNSAWADGDRVMVGENFPGLAYDEAAFAAAIAHEMAHNILRHPQTFHEIGWKRRLVRLSERDADRLMPWLLENAGYDPRAAIRFMRTWGPKHGGWIFRARTHDGWDERVEFIEAELPKIEQAKAMRDDGLADWQQYFDSELTAELSKK